MKFGQHLAVHMTPEWKDSYMRYDAIKGLMYSRLQEMPSSIEKVKRTEFLTQFEHEFFTIISQELTKVNDFYIQKLAEFDAKFRKLNNEISQPQIGLDKNRHVSTFTSQISEKRKYDVYRAFRELYLGLVLLEAFQDLNYSAFCKILKKYDKHFASERGKYYIVETVQQAPFHQQNAILDNLLRDIEDIITRVFENGDRAKALDKLKVPPLGKAFERIDVFWMGLLAGALFILLLNVTWGFIAKLDNTTHDWRTFLRFYRPAFLFNFYIVLVGINMYFWKYYGVNHLIIFELDPANHLDPQHLFILSGAFFCVTCLSSAIFLFAKDFNIPLYSSPIALYAFYCIFFINPIKGYSSARWWLAKKGFRILTAPIFKVEFADFWVTDQLASLTPIILDIHYIGCFYVFKNDVFNLPNATSLDCLTTCHCQDPTLPIRPIIRILPEYFRFLQCCRRFYSTLGYIHIINAIKYAMTFVVVLLSTLHSANKLNNPNYFNQPTFILWVVMATINSLYGYFWDVFFDWGLFANANRENRYLRDELLYPAKAFYYFAMVFDFVLRFLWAFSLSLSEMGIIQGDYSVTVFAPLELIRRFIWNFFRLENEHVNNCGQYRAITDLSIRSKSQLLKEDAPENEDIVTLMDFSDGVEFYRDKHSLDNIPKGSHTISQSSFSESPSRLTRLFSY